jgi:hypothetical protein
VFCVNSSNGSSITFESLDKLYLSQLPHLSNGDNITPIIKLNELGQGVVALTYNPSFLGGGDKWIMV